MKVKIIFISFAVILLIGAIRMVTMVEERGENFTLQILSFHGLFEPDYGICREPKELCLESIETALMILERHHFKDKAPKGVENSDDSTEINNSEDLNRSENSVNSDDTTDVDSSENTDDSIAENEVQPLSATDVVDKEKVKLLLGAGIKFPPKEFDYDAAFLSTGELYVNDGLSPDSFSKNVSILKISENEEIGVIGIEWDKWNELSNEVNAQTDEAKQETDEKFGKEGLAKLKEKNIQLPNINPKNNPLFDELETQVKALAKSLVEKDINKIILLGKIPLVAAKRLAHEVRDVDIILAGGLKDHSDESYPLAITNSSKQTTLIFYQNYKSDPMFGLTEILFNGRGGIVGWKEQTQRLIAE